MNKVLTELDYEDYIVSQFAQAGYVAKFPKESGGDYLPEYAIDKEELFAFLKATQQDALDEIARFHDEEIVEKIVLGAINAEEQKGNGGRLHVLKHGVRIDNLQLKLMYTKPATSFNPEQIKLYESNIFSVMPEVRASQKERVDLVLFLNGLAFATFELKCNAAGQSYKHAIAQFRTDRDPKTRLFQFKAGALVHFAMDLNEVYMTTKLDGDKTYFLPFNRGRGDGIETTAGNPPSKPGDADYPVSYMWRDVMRPDSVLDIIARFMFVDVKENPDNPRKPKETVVFPRFHQLDVIRRLVEDVRVNRTARNYLLQHSTGSGKTNEISWLAHRLATLHDDKDKMIFDNIVVCTDRVVVDRQLQRAVLGIEHKSGLVRAIGDKCTSEDLARALRGNTKIVLTTLQKFPYILDSVRDLKEKNFAVIIDESHSSTAGKTMEAVKQTLGSESFENESDAPAEMIEEHIANYLRRSGKQKNVAMFGFTATPKATTLEIFGTTNEHGQKAPFHIYSMKQAIDEGFILDVLQNYTTYDTTYKLNKTIEDDPDVKVSPTKRQIWSVVEQTEVNIDQRVAIIVEHFRSVVMHELGGQAKAMVVTSSRLGAVKYRLAFEKYLAEKRYDDLRAIVAFSGKVTLDGQEYSEAKMNGFSEKALPDEFDSDAYQILLVADKYQTGFDQKKLCAMYVLKGLRGVAAVQTLSRLNRICPPFDKKTFVLDFVNDYVDIEAAFSKFYTGTILAKTASPNDIYEIDARIDSYGILDHDDIDEFNSLYIAGEGTAATSARMSQLLQNAKKRIDDYDEEQSKAIALDIRHFLRLYEFLMQATALEDVALHKKYTFLSCLRAYLRADDAGAGFDVKDKIVAYNFRQKKTGEFKPTKHPSDPVVKLPSAERCAFTKSTTKRLSEIISEINAKMGTKFDPNVATASLLTLREILRKSDDLKVKAQNNTLANFKLAFNSDADDALVEGLDSNFEFFTLMLNNPEIKTQLLGAFAQELYKELRKKD